MDTEKEAIWWITETKDVYQVTNRGGKGGDHHQGDPEDQATDHVKSVTDNDDLMIKP